MRERGYRDVGLKGITSDGGYSCGRPSLTPRQRGFREVRGRLCSEVVAGGSMAHLHGYVGEARRRVSVLHSVVKVGVGGLRRLGAGCRGIRRGFTALRANGYLMCRGSSFPLSVPAGRVCVGLFDLGAGTFRNVRRGGGCEAPSTESFVAAFFTSYDRGVGRLLLGPRGRSS